MNVIPHDEPVRWSVPQIKLAEALSNFTSKRVSLLKQVVIVPVYNPLHLSMISQIKQTLSF